MKSILWRQVQSCERSFRKQIENSDFKLIKSRQKSERSNWDRLEKMKKIKITILSHHAHPWLRRKKLKLKIFLFPGASKTFYVDKKTLCYSELFRRQCHQKTMKWIKQTSRALVSCCCYYEENFLINSITES
jgi:hypothetical protein